MSERNFKTREGYDIWDKLCAIPKYGFLIGPSGGVVKVLDIGNWIDRDEAQRVVDEAQSEVNLLREERDQLRAELAAIRGQEPVGHQFQDREGEWHNFTNQRHYEATVKDGTWPIRAIYALPPKQPDAVSVPSDTALRRAAKFLAGIDNGCNEVKTLRALVANAQVGKAVSVPDGLVDVMTAVYRELEHRKGDRRGNAPGHGHAIPGVWDEDNGALAGTTCAWCALWNKGKEMLERAALSTRQAEEDEPCAK